MKHSKSRKQDKQAVQAVERYFDLSRQELFPSPIHLFSSDAPDWISMPADVLLENRISTLYGSWGLYQDYFFSYSPSDNDGTLRIYAEKSTGQRVCCWAVPAPNCYVVGYLPDPDDTPNPGLVYTSSLVRYLCFEGTDPGWILDRYEELGDPPLHQTINSEAYEKYKDQVLAISGDFTGSGYGMFCSQWLPGSEQVQPQERWRFPYKGVYHTMSWKKG